MKDSLLISLLLVDERFINRFSHFFYLLLFFVMLSLNAESLGFGLFVVNNLKMLL